MHQEFCLARAFDLIGGPPVAIVGSGGKTTILYQLAQDMWKAGQRPVLTTTTKMFWPTDQLLVRPCCLSEFCEWLPQSDCIPLIYRLRRQDKIDGIDSDQLKYVERLVKNRPILYEADGSRRRPLKIHADHEPVIVAAEHTVLLVVGLSQWGQLVSDENCHRLELSDWSGRNLDETFLLLYLERCLKHIESRLSQAGRPGRRLVLLNQLDGVPPEERESLTRNVALSIGLSVLGRALDPAVGQRLYGLALGEQQLWGH